MSHSPRERERPEGVGDFPVILGVDTFCSVSERLSDYYRVVRRYIGRFSHSEHDPHGYET